MPTRKIQPYHTLLTERRTIGQLYNLKNHFLPQQCHVLAGNQRLQDQISIQWADIATLKVDAVVNAAQPTLTPGGGICGAIFAAAGDELEEECSRFGRGIKAGQAVLTRGCQLTAPYIIHAVGPNKDVVGEKERASELLSDMYTRIFELCKANKIRKIAIPSISSGIYGIDPTLCAFEACKSAVFALLDDDLPHLEVIFVLFDPKIEGKDQEKESTRAASFFLDALQ
ncbi:A1pp-domain-containing [Fusarium albosuccineum]|uniref:A1pp-domain-containing n=1 Tax=Fusarium albosuccineum TaxID=1237068 RepID=A0A8H4PCI7_9HYPO|nr:A1pp-domain-containing [Fusarium albosuccineum]